MLRRIVAIIAICLVSSLAFAQTPNKNILRMNGGVNPPFIPTSPPSTRCFRRRSTPIPGHRSERSRMRQGRSRMRRTHKLLL